MWRSVRKRRPRVNCVEASAKRSGLDGSLRFGERGTFDRFDSMQTPLRPPVEPKINENKLVPLDFICYESGAVVPAA